MPNIASSLSRRLSRSRDRKRGTLQGTVVFVGQERTHRVSMEATTYDAEHYEEHTLASVGEVKLLLQSEGVKWFLVDGVHDATLVERLGETFRVHSLVQEDVASTTQRAKCEPYEGYLYAVLPMLTYNEVRAEIEIEQVSFILGQDWLLCFLEDPGDVFGPVRERLRLSKGSIRRHKADFLLSSLVDVIVDEYFIVLEKLSDLVEELEEEVVRDPTPRTQARINMLRRELVLLRRSVWPVREMLSQMERSESSLVDPQTRVYFRDVYDHSVQVLDIVESLREVVSGLMELYMSSLSNRMNEVMKFLTVVGTIFIPLTFISSIYGMNFEFMPELHLRYGYYIALALMLGIAVGMLFFFKRKRWL